MIDGLLLITTYTARFVAFFLVPLYLYYRDREKLYPYISSLFFVLVVTYGLKYGLNVPRPEGALIDVVTPRFPSGHTSIAFTPLLFFPSWKGRSLILAYGGLVAYTRIHFNVHVPVDLAASIIIALFVSYLCLSKKDYINRKLGSFLKDF
ncbi:MAG: phosphatase PAP2 family protein [Candidatus Aenigmatarchaeota archaeon]